MRQAGFTLDDLKSFLENEEAVPCNIYLGCPGVDGVPTGLVINEIVMVFLECGDDPKRAKQELFNLLVTSRFESKVLALTFLLNHKDKLDKNEIKSLCSYIEDPVNFDVVKETKDVIIREANY